MTAAVPPSTPLAIAARRLVHDECEPHVATHCERSVRFAALVAETDGIDVDLEVVYLGTILHDVGLARRYQGQARFEAAGANVARQFLLDGGLEPARAESVWDIVALHATSALAQHKSPETAVSSAGISIDVRGVGAERLPLEAIREVLDAFPRAGFPALFHQTLVDEVRRNPVAVRLSWMEGIARHHVDGYEPADFEAGLLASSTFV